MDGVRAGRIEEGWQAEASLEVVVAVLRSLEDWRLQAVRLVEQGATWAAVVREVPRVELRRVALRLVEARLVGVEAVLRAALRPPARPAAASMERVSLVHSRWPVAPLASRACSA